MIGAKQRKEIRASMKRSWILDKAGMLFWQNGYHSTRMRDIAKACECQPPNFYNYFKSKEEILYEVIKSITEQGVLSIQHLDEDETNPVEQLRLLIKSHFIFLVGMKQSNVLLYDTGIKYLSSEHQKEIIKLRDAFDSILRKIIRRGIDAGCFAPTDARIAGYLISSIIIRSSIWFSTKGRLSVDELVDIMFNFAYNGIRAGNDNQPVTTHELNYCQVLPL